MRITKAKVTGNGHLEASYVDDDENSIDYKGKNPYLFIEEKGLTGSLIDAVKKHWEENERHLVDVTFGGRKPRYE